MQFEKTYYDRLHIAADAQEDEIREARLCIVRRDRASLEWVREVCDILLDPDRRSIYDASLAEDRTSIRPWAEALGRGAVDAGPVNATYYLDFRLSNGRNCAIGPVRAASYARAVEVFVARRGGSAPRLVVPPGASLAGASLSRMDLRGLVARDCPFVGADLGGTRLMGADLARANFTRANLAHASLAGADLSHAIFSGACLEGTNFDGARRAVVSLDLVPDGAASSAADADRGQPAAAPVLDDQAPTPRQGDRGQGL